MVGSRLIFFSSWWASKRWNTMPAKELSQADMDFTRWKNWTARYGQELTAEYSRHVWCWCWVSSPPVNDKGEYRVCQSKEGYRSCRVRFEVTRLRVFLETKDAFKLRLQNRFRVSATLRRRTFSGWQVETDRKRLPGGMQRGAGECAM